MKAVKWTFNGETHSIRQWEKITGFKRSTMSQRYRLGWPIEKILTESAGKVARHKNATMAGQTPTYRVWIHMRDRCRNIKGTAYKYYGGRGIKVCERWNDFRNFLADMGERPLNATLDRIDNAGHYEPANCRWATRKEQVNNTRYNVLLTFRGETHNISQWAEKIGISHITLRSRIRYGWSIERILTQPLRSEFLRDPKTKRFA